MTHICTDFCNQQSIQYPALFAGCSGSLTSCHAAEIVAKEADVVEVADVEEAAVEAMRTGLQCSHLAADTVFTQIKALTGAPSADPPAAESCKCLCCEYCMVTLSICRPAARN